jgi:glucosamine--fructose-6-phosphate aminotransferase (isomerizing)
MNFEEKRYSQFAIIREMLETPGIIKNFNTKSLKPVLASLSQTKKLFLSGEGSSRIFPAKNAIYQNLKENLELTILTECSRQASELDIRSFTLFGASNSGKTKEVIDLFNKRKAKAQFALTANKEAPLSELSEEAFVLNCGKEEAVAATKSVIEQALFYQNLIYQYSNKNFSKKDLSELSEKARTVLQMKIDEKIISRVAKAPRIFFSGRNNGVAEEATLKTNEITRKKSEYLEGTYAVHGIEESMDKNEVVIVINPFSEEEKKFKEVLVDGVGLSVFAISSKDTLFPTIKIPEMNNFNGYLELLACWNLLVEVGLKLKLNLDKTERARKIGNEAIPTKKR